MTSSDASAKNRTSKSFRRTLQFYLINCSTPLGKAMRVGSVVARLEIAPTPLPYDDHHAYCLYYTQGVCGRCIDRCPAGAITPAGHDKVACKAYIRQRAMPHIKRTYGFEGRGCGLCQTKVPCESKIPLKKELPGA